MAATFRPVNGGLSTISDLPSDTLNDIFIRLPVKSIFHCARVCSTWRTLIRQRSSDACRLSLKPPHINLIVVQSPEVILLELMCDDSFSFRVIKESQIDFRYGWLKFVGLCNGLVCVLERSSDKVILFNPTLDTQLVLPRPYRNSDQCETLGLGFGYTSSSDQYKVVRICRIPKLGIIGHVSRTNGRSPLPKIVAVGKGSPISGISSLGQSVFHDDAIIWLGDDGRYLVYYDMKKEKLGCIRFGPGMFQGDNNNTIGVYYDDKGISHLYIAEEHKSSLLHIWVMEDYKCIKSLHLKFIIQPPDLNWRRVQSLLKVFKDGRLLISLERGGVMCYDPETWVNEIICTPGKYQWCETLVDAPSALGCLIYEDWARALRF